MNESPRSPTERLQRALSEIAELAQGRLPPDSFSVVARRENVDRAATLLIELYGDGALERALLIEQQSVQPSFARSVRQRIEKLGE